MTSPIQLDKTYGVLHTENYFSFLGFAKKIGSHQTQKIDVFLDDKLIDTIEANEFIQKIDDMYDVESKAFTYNLPTQYIGTKAIISFKNHDSGEELVNSPYTLIDKNHEKFNEAKFLHSLSEPLSEELKNMYKQNSVGFLATKENLENEEFVEYINQIMNDFPEYDFKALYFDKNSIKEIKNKFKENINLEFLKLNTIKDIFINLQVLLGNFNKNKIEISLANFLILNSDNIACIPLNLHLNKSITIKQFSESIRNHYHNFFENIELFGYTKKDIEIYGKDLIKIMTQNAIDKYNLKIEIDMQSSIRKLLFITLYIGLKNNDYYFKIINIDRLNTKLLQNKL